MHANPCSRHATSPYIRHRQATNYFQSHTTFPYYRSCEHVCKPLLSSHNVSLLSTSTGNQLCSASHNFPYYRSCEHVCKPLLSSHNVSLLSILTGNQLFSASHNVSLLSLMWTCTQIAFLVTQPLLVIAHVNMKHCIVRQATSFSVWHRFPIIAHVKKHADRFLLSHDISLLSTSTGNQLFSASVIVSLLSLMWTCTQTSGIVTQHFPIVDIDRQPTIFGFSHRFPIIAHVNMHANFWYRHTTFPYCRHRQATNYFQHHTTSPYYRSLEHARKPLLSSHNVFLLSTSTGNQLFQRHTTFPYYRSREHARK